MDRINIMLLCMALVACDAEWKFWKNHSPVIAEVENSRLYISDLMETKAEGEVVSKEEWTQRIEYWVNFEVMHTEALKKGLHKDPEVQKLIKEAQRKILVDRLRLSMDNYDVASDKEQHEFYEKNRELFRIDSVSFMPFADVKKQIRNALISEKRTQREKKWLTETKNNYTIEIYLQYLDSIK